MEDEKKKILLLIVFDNGGKISKEENRKLMIIIIGIIVLNKSEKLVLIQGWIIVQFNHLPQGITYKVIIVIGRFKLESKFVVEWEEE